jgi:hypothetical protein
VLGSPRASVWSTSAFAVGSSGNGARIGPLVNQASTREAIAELKMTSPEHQDPEAANKLASWSLTLSKMPHPRHRGPRPAAVFPADAGLHTQCQAHPKNVANKHGPWEFSQIYPPDEACDRSVVYHLCHPRRIDREEPAYMAQKVIRQFIDDIDGAEAERTFSFAVDGTHYEIDLSSHNIKEFHEAIAGFVESARKVKASGGGRRVRKTSTSDPGRSREQTQAMREWARQQGHSINDRGRIPASIQQAFDQAHQGAQPVAVG